MNNQKLEWQALWDAMDANPARDGLSSECPGRCGDGALSGDAASVGARCDREASRLKRRREADVMSTRRDRW